MYFTSTNIMPDDSNNYTESPHTLLTICKTVTVDLKKTLKIYFSQKLNVNAINLISKLREPKLRI